MAKAKKPPLTKAEVLNHFAEKFEITKKAAGEFFDELVSLAATETKKKGEFTLPGVGKLVVTKRKARMGRNPATGESIKIPAKNVAKMKLSKTFKDAVE